MGGTLRSRFQQPGQEATGGEKGGWPRGGRGSADSPGDGWGSDGEEGAHR